MSKDFSKIKVTRKVVVSTSPAPQAPVRYVVKKQPRTAQRTADICAFLFDRSQLRVSTRLTQFTKYEPNNYLGFTAGWQNRVSGKASADKIERFNVLRNSLDHYARYFATSKVARDCYRANYAEMKAIYTHIAKDEKCMLSPHDMETW